MNKKYQIQFTHRCAVLLEAGIPLSEVLSIIGSMEKSSNALLIKIRDGVERGISLSRSMTIATYKFDPTLVSMISYGESSGTLALSMRQACEIMGKRDELLKKIVSMLVYPSIIVLATAGMTLFLVMYIFPKILPLLSGMNVTLPLMTRVVKETYEMLSLYGLWISILLIIAVSAFLYAYKARIEFRRKAQMFLLIIPVAGNALKKYFICSYCRSAGTLLDCGQRLPAILDQCADSSTFEPYKRAFMIAKGEVLRGVSLSDCLRSFETIFPPAVPDMLSIGERTGSLSSMLHHVNRMYEQDLDYLIKQVSTAIEPVLMVGMGLIVGSVALSIILPIYEITNHLSR